MIGGVVHQDHTRLGAAEHHVDFLRVGRMWMLLLDIDQHRLLLESGARALHFGDDAAVAGGPSAHATSYSTTSCSYSDACILHLKRAPLKRLSYL